MSSLLNADYLVRITSFVKQGKGLYPPGMVTIDLDALEEITLPYAELPYNSAVVQYNHWHLYHTPKEAARVFGLAQTMLGYFWNYWLNPIEFCSSYYGGDWRYDADTLKFRRTDYDMQWRMLFTISQLLTTRCAPYGPHLLEPTNIIHKEGAKVAAVMLMLGIELDDILNFLRNDIIIMALRVIKEKGNTQFSNGYRISYSSTVRNILRKEKSPDNVYLLNKLNEFYEVYSDTFKFHRIVLIETKGVGNSFVELDKINEYNTYLHEKSIFSLVANTKETSSWMKQIELNLGHKNYYGYTYGDSKKMSKPSNNL